MTKLDSVLNLPNIAATLHNIVLSLDHSDDKQELEEIFEARCEKAELIRSWIEEWYDANTDPEK